MDNKQLRANLIQLGLTDKESDIYIELVKNGASSIVEISKYTGIKRTTAHNNVDELISKGLVVQTKIGGRRKVVANPPSELQTILRGRKTELEQIESNLPTTVAALKELISSTSLDNTIWAKFYEGKENISQLYSEVLASKEIYSIADVNKVLAVLPENFELFKEKLASDPDFIMYEIVVYKDEEEAPAPLVTFPNYHQKTLYSKDGMGVDIICFDDKTVFLDFNGSIPTAVILDNKTISWTLRSVIKMFWQGI